MQNIFSEKTGKKVAIIFFACLLFYSPYFFTENVGEWDSYYYLNLFSIKPEAFLLVKLLTFCLFFASALFIALLGSVFVKDGWLAGVFSLAAPVFVQQFWRFENDLLALPLIFASIWLFFSGKKIFSISLLCFAFIFWQASALLLIPFSFSFTPLLFASIPLIFFIIFRQLGSFLPNFNVIENMPFLALFLCFFSLFGLGSMPKKLRVSALFFFVLALANAKWVILLIPFLAVGLTRFWREGGANSKSVAAAALIVSLLISFALLPVFPPTVEQVSAIKLAVDQAQGQTIYNDWTYGTAIEYYGGTPLAKYGGKQPDLNCFNCIVLSPQEFDCKCLNCPSRLPVWKC